MMTPFRVAISGIDGTGKTTVIRQIRKLYAKRPSEVYAFRSPQFHEDPFLPHVPLSEMIDVLSVQADLRNDSALKSIALFLSMTLYGDVERHLLTGIRPQVLIGERQCILDTLAYGQFYFPLLAKKSSPRNIRADLQEILGVERTECIENWLTVVARRETSFPLSLDQVTQYMVQVFQGPPEVVVQRLLRMYNAEIPDALILLSTSPEDLKIRLTEKKAGSRVSELHEQASTLAQLELALKKCALLLKKIKPSLVIHELHTENKTISETVQSILDLCGVST